MIDSKMTFWSSVWGGWAGRLFFLVKKIVISCTSTFPSLRSCIQKKDWRQNNMITIFFPITIVTTWVDSQQIFQVGCHTHPSIIISNVVRFFLFKRNLFGGYLVWISSGIKSLDYGYNTFFLLGYTKTWHS